jgi:hypothetical protein
MGELLGTTRPAGRLSFVQFTICGGLAAELTDVHARDGYGLSLLAQCRGSHSCKNGERGGKSMVVVYLNESWEGALTIPRFLAQPISYLG